MRREEKNLLIVLASRYFFMEGKKIFLVPLPLNSFLKNVPSPNWGVKVQNGAKFCDICFLYTHTHTHTINYNPTFSSGQVIFLSLYIYIYIYICSFIINGRGKGNYLIQFCQHHSSHHLDFVIETNFTIPKFLRAWF